MAQTEQVKRAEADGYKRGVSDAYKNEEKTQLTMTGIAVTCLLVGIVFPPLLVVGGLLLAAAFFMAVASAGIKALSSRGH